MRATARALPILCSISSLPPPPQSQAPSCGQAWRAGENKALFSAAGSGPLYVLPGTVPRTRTGPPWAQGLGWLTVRFIPLAAGGACKPAISPGQSGRLWTTRWRSGSQACITNEVPVPDCMPHWRAVGWSPGRYCRVWNGNFLGPSSRQLDQLVKQAA